MNTLHRWIEQGTSTGHHDRPCATTDGSRHGTLWFIEIIDELVTEADAGVHEDRAVRVQYAEAIDGNLSTGWRGGVGLGQADDCEIEAHDRGHLGESGHAVIVPPTSVVADHVVFSERCSTTGATGAPRGRSPYASQNLRHGHRDCRAVAPLVDHSRASSPFPVVADDVRGVGGRVRTAVNVRSVGA